jgi:hypothetical protein
MCARHRRRRTNLFTTMKKVLIALIIVLILGVGAWYFASVNGITIPGLNGSVSPTMGAAVGNALDGKENTIVDVPTEPVPPLEKEYTNKTYRFTVKMPEDFTARELPPDQNGARSILLENLDGAGIQIYVTPDKDNLKTLTAADVRASIPDMRVVGEQDVNIGPNDKGVAFKSDSEAFGGNSREVWFYFRGNLYQISTYARLDPLLKAMFGTWQFF